ncbi:fibro-slime domain-containing protein [Corallincola spongiicola]|uniref:Fibro-slime domain-containing protein n=1 Tax=Corallincola spongiicola TaxID=2520508 RepID=A0ABY1WME1_9GAMM|nr:fibro-slime domain-containing protein [Corallincola spongiicola]TAA43584.1 fibro-slime domain-containing protein [Corallincola spongiicola]
MKCLQLITVIAFSVCSVVSANAGVLTLSGTIYDKVAAEADFEDPCCSGLVTGLVSSTLAADGLPEFVANDGDGDITSAASFDAWWMDTNGTKAFDLDLTETAPDSGVFSYTDSAFFPIDNELAGNEGRNHNYHFTMHLEGITTFKETDVFAFLGDDDLWVYIDGKLVMDLGGVHAAVSDTLTGADLMAMGLAEDTEYDLDIFFAERHTVASNFNIATSFRVKSEVPAPQVLLMFGLAVCAVRLLRRQSN